MKTDFCCNNIYFKGRVKFLTPKQMHNPDLRPLIHHLKYHSGGKNVLHEISLDEKTLRVNSVKTTDSSVFEKCYTHTAINGQIDIEFGVKKILEMLKEAANVSKKINKSNNNSAPLKKASKILKSIFAKIVPERFFKSSPTL